MPRQRKQSPELERAVEQLAMLIDSVRSENISLVTDAQIDSWFKYHAPKGTQGERYELIRSAGKALARVILCNTPPGPDQNAAIRKVRETVATANAAIACGEA